MCTQRITELIISWMEAYITHTFSTPYAKKRWLIFACFRDIKYREVAHKMSITY